MATFVVLRHPDNKNTYSKQNYSKSYTQTSQIMPCHFAKTTHLGPQPKTSARGGREPTINNGFKSNPTFLLQILF